MASKGSSPSKWKWNRLVDSTINILHANIPISVPMIYSNMVRSLTASILVVKRIAVIDGGVTRHWRCISPAIKYTRLQVFHEVHQTLCAILISRVLRDSISRFLVGPSVRRSVTKLF